MPYQHVSTSYERVSNTVQGLGLTENDLATAVQTVVTTWLIEEGVEAAERALSNPRALGRLLAGAVHDEFVANEIEVNINDFLQSKPALHLCGVFDTSRLPATPENFFPIPTSKSTVAARASVIAIHSFLGLETIAYGSENSGHLFVNLVTLPGESIFAEKSKDKMSGHTDAVSFPFAGEQDTKYPRISASPDFVTLAGLRNPEQVPTTVMPLAPILDQLKEEDIDELLKKQFLVRSQLTFRKGTKAILGEEHTMSETSILHRVANETWVRFSHKSVGADESQTAALDAIEAFKNACPRVSVPMVVEPGDILLVNNRRALHGRGTPSGLIGGDSRWLLRTYGLRPAAINEVNRTGQPGVLYP
jgi:L-asparagine oxygenase